MKKKKKTKNTGKSVNNARSSQNKQAYSDTTSNTPELPDLIFDQHEELSHSLDSDFDAEISFSAPDDADAKRESALAELDSNELFPEELSDIIDPVIIYEEVFGDAPESEAFEAAQEPPEPKLPPIIDMIPEPIEEASPVIEDIPESTPLNNEPVMPEAYDAVAAILAGLEPIENLLSGMELGANILDFAQPALEVKPAIPEEKPSEELSIDDVINSIIAEQKLANAKAEEEAKAAAEAKAAEEEAAAAEAKAEALIHDLEAEAKLNPDEEIIKAYEHSEVPSGNTRVADAYEPALDAEAEPNPDEEIIKAYESSEVLSDNTRAAEAFVKDDVKLNAYEDILDSDTRHVPDISDDTREYESELGSIDTRNFETVELIDDEDISPADYAKSDNYEELAAEHTAKEPKERISVKKTFHDVIGTPVIHALAFITMKIQQSRLSFRAAAPREDEDLGTEMAPDKAAKFYDNHISWLRLRSKLAFISALVLVYISFGLPVFGALRDIGVKSAVCLILLLTTMLIGIDIFTSGIVSLIRRKPNANALIAISSLLCVIDAFIIAAGGKDNGLPFCAIPALTISFSLLGSVMNCRSSRIACNTAASVRNPYTLTAETSVTGDGITLLKSKAGTKDFVRRVEEAGPDETVYGFLAPYLMAAALLLSLIAAIAGHNFAGFAHILSGIFAAAAPVVMLIVFPLPFFVSAKGLIKNGSTIAGWSGLYDIGKSKHVIISDFDLFSKGNVKIEKARILSGMDHEKVISYAGSIIAASGSTLAPAFSDLMKKGNGTLKRIDEFTCHESGGLIAMIDGEQVLCGTAAFMQLMGIRLPQKIMQKSCVFLAAGGVLCGIFEMEYTVTDTAKNALYSLMSSNRHPIFAVRDFNVTPQMLSLKFDMATDGFDFPSFPERYDISGASPSEDSKPSAIISREGLGPLVDLADHGVRLYTRIRVCVMLSVLCTVIGMLTMFVLGILGTMSVVSALTYMLVWLIPVVVLSFTIKIP